MFLIEYEKDSFVNGVNIDWLRIKKGSIEFTMTGDNESSFKVTEECQGTFINNLQAINQNGGVEARYSELNPKDT